MPDSETGVPRHPTALTGDHASLECKSDNVTPPTTTAGVSESADDQTGSTDVLQRTMPDLKTKSGADKSDASDSINGENIDDRFELVDTRQQEDCQSADDDKSSSTTDTKRDIIGADDPDDANDSESTCLRRSRRRNVFRPLCVDCGADCSAIWTRVSTQLLLCHTCATIRDTSTSTTSSSNHHHQQQHQGVENRVEVEEGLVEVEGSMRRLRRCVRNQRRQPVSAVNPASARGRGRRTILKKTPIKCPDAVATTITTEFLFHKGVYYQIGDIVSLLSLQRRVYYAQIRGLLQDQYMEKSAVITWLIPTTSSPPPERTFDPATYVIGPDEDLPRRLDCMQFVCRAPSDYFKLRNAPYPTAAPHLSARGARFVYTRLGPVAVRHGDSRAHDVESE